MSSLALHTRAEAALRRVIVRPSTVGLVKPASASYLTMYDDVTPSAMPRGGDVYAGYYDGSFANMSSIRRDFPGKYYLEISPYGTNGAECIDIENGDATPSDGPAFFRNRSHGNAVKPWFYGSASVLTAIEDALSSAGIHRSEYFLWSAHYIGFHFCGPNSCGYGRSQADATQYATGNYDVSVVQPYCFAKSPAPSPSPSPSPSPVLLSPGSTSEDDTMAVLLPPVAVGATPSSVGVSFNGNSTYKTIGFLADPSFLGTANVVVRTAFHSGNGATWSVVNTTLTAQSPKAVVDVPKWADGASFTRGDNVDVGLVPNFS